MICDPKRITPYPPNFPQAYLPIDYIRSRELCPAVDTFCYGIFMFELVCGRSPSHTPTGVRDNMRNIFLDIDGSASWRSDIDRWVDNKIPWDLWAYILTCLGWVCTKLTKYLGVPC